MALCFRLYSSSRGRNRREIVGRPFRSPNDGVGTPVAFTLFFLFLFTFNLTLSAVFKCSSILVTHLIMAVEQVDSSSILTIQEENKRLKRAVDELSILNDLARAIGASLNSEEVMQTIIRRSLRAVGAEQGIITLVDKDSIQPAKTLVRAMVSSSEHEQFHLTQTLLGWMHLNKKPLLMNDPKNDERFRGAKWDELVNSIVCVPLMVKSQLLGVLTLYNKKDGKKFTDEDQRLLAIIAAQSAQVVEAARLYEEEKAYSLMQEEVRLAAQIQFDLLPKSVPRVPNYDLAGKTLPAQMVGGDYFDFIPTEDNRWAICLGDVSGKGLPASLLMANVQATLRGQAMLNQPPSQSVRRSNKLLYMSTSSEKFVTLFYGLLDPAQNLFTYSNAGHNPPMLFSPTGSMRLLETGGTVLSILEDFPFEEEKVELKQGDILMVFSDGVTEAMNAEEELFGEERLEKVIEKHRSASAASIIDEIVTAVREFAGPTPQADDITMIVVKRI